ncbi:hypothetical protein LMG26854_03196 [Achromobacter aegrifaciens]|nr:hypothetical protein LMG26854_03196 [Achromobacter aegrifaciens]
MPYTRQHMAPLIRAAIQCGRSRFKARTIPFVRYGCLLIPLFCTLAAAQGQPSQPLPQMPTPPTITACRKFSHDVFVQLSGIYRQQSQCMSQTRANIGAGLECNALTGIVRRTVTAWPQCFESSAEDHCELLRLRSLAQVCIQQAQTSAGKSRQAAQTVAKLAEAEQQGRSLISAFQNTRDAFNDPKEFIQQQLQDHLNSEILSIIRQPSGDLNPAGLGPLQEVYDYLFDKTLANDSLLSGNPVIHAIQGEIAQRIRLAHAANINQLRHIVESIEHIDSEPGQSRPNPQRAPLIRPTSPAIPGDADCALLDSEARIDFVQDHPDEFEALVKRCGARR